MFKLFAKKSLGQNFLVNQGVVERIIRAAEIGSNDYVVEVGPGTGNLTRELAKSAGTVIAIEKDQRAIEELKKSMPTNVQVIESDVLELKIEELFENLKLKIENYKIVANLPYYITSHFLRVMLEEWPRPALAVLMVQKEVAQRMMAQPPDMNLLALSVQYYADAEKIMDVSRGSFRPMPKVESSVIRLNPKHEIRNPKETELLFKLAKAAFAGKRKQLLTTLPGAIGKTKEETVIILERSGINPMARPETLYLEDWLKIAKEV